MRLTIGPKPNFNIRTDGGKRSACFYHVRQIREQIQNITPPSLGSGHWQLAYPEDILYILRQSAHSSFFLTIRSCLIGIPFHKPSSALLAPWPSIPFGAGPKRIPREGTHAGYGLGMRLPSGHSSAWLFFS